LLTNEVYKHKSRLNIHGGQQQYGIKFWEMFSPIAMRATVRFFIVLIIIYGWFTLQIDFILVYAQADAECDLYMRIPKGFTIKDENRFTLVLKILKNLYGQKQAGHVWNQHLHKALIKLGWVQRDVDDCL
jgi:Reverse transcriptase (RNA-dependent DNA polymerase)